MTGASHDEISTLIERSSLGAPGARKLRARTTSQQRSQIIRRAAGRASADPPRSSAGFPRGCD